ncbi:MAG: bifunctional 5,10-methylenetetrahydrofolate dehydrogenase/5,10-methenyltetrahydrofolate cyclohydrolase [Candidatus Poribacteria bacterium]
MLLSAKPVVNKIKHSVSEQVRSFIEKYSRRPKLSVILVGCDPASIIYTGKKGEAAIAVGIEHETISLPENTSPKDVKSVLQRLNSDPLVDGILIQRPLPKGFPEKDVVFLVSPEKDVDAFHPLNIGKFTLGLPGLKPCTPAGIMELLNFYNILPESKIVTIIGRSSIVGKPMAAMFLQANATIIQCHSKTSNLRELSKQADILVVAAGKAGLIDSSYIKSNAVVVDVGIHKTNEGKIIGDVLFDDVIEKVSAITPVPGGVGPMTIAMLLQNTLFAANNREEPSRLCKSQF